MKFTITLESKYDIFKSDYSKNGNNLCRFKDGNVYIILNRKAIRGRYKKIRYVRMSEEEYQNIPDFKWSWNEYLDEVVANKPLHLDDSVDWRGNNKYVLLRKYITNVHCRPFNNYDETIEYDENDEDFYQWKNCLVKRVVVNDEVNEKYSKHKIAILLENSGYVTLISKYKLDRISEYKLYSRIEEKNVYAGLTINGRNSRLHRLINSQYDEIDHINGFGLDNTTHNLRNGGYKKDLLMKKRVNNWNRCLNENNKSGHNNINEMYRWQIYCPSVPEIHGKTKCYFSSDEDKKNEAKESVIELAKEYNAENIACYYHYSYWVVYYYNSLNQRRRKNISWKAYGGSENAYTEAVAFLSAINPENENGRRPKRQKLIADD